MSIEDLNFFKKTKFIHQVLPHHQVYFSTFFKICQQNNKKFFIENESQYHGIHWDTL